jgi:hypothetical protein
MGAAPMPDDLRSIIANLLPDGGEDRLGAAVREAVRPIIHDAFRKGLRIGLGMGREAVTSGLDEAMRSIEAAFETPRAAPPKREPRQTVARGTIAPLIDLVLADSPGLRATEVEAKVVELDSNVTPASVGNELRRQNNKRYRRDDGMRWHLIGGTGKEKAEAGSFGNGADSWVGGTDQAAA